MKATNLDYSNNNLDYSNTNLDYIDNLQFTFQ